MEQNSKSFSVRAEQKITVDFFQKWSSDVWKNCSCGTVSGKKKPDRKLFLFARKSQMETPVQKIKTCSSSIELNRRY